MNRQDNLPVLIAGGGIGGLAAALALTRQGFQVKVLEQAPEIGEIGAGIQLGPNAFHAFDALGVGEKARSRAVYTDYMVMHDAIDEYQVGKIPTGQAFRQRFGNPYLKHSVHQIAMDSSQKIPQRWPPSVLGQMAAGQSFEHHALAAAIFLRYTLAVDEQGQAYTLNDPQSDSLQAIGAHQVADASGSLNAFLSRADLWGAELPHNTLWAERVAYWHDQVVHQGVDATVKFAITLDA